MLSRSIAALVRDALDHLESTASVEWGEAEGAVRITAPAALLRQASLVAIDEAGERVSARCTSLLRGTGNAESVLAETADLDGLMRLLKLVGGSS